MTLSRPKMPSASPSMDTMVDVISGLGILGLPVVLAGSLVVALAAALPMGYAVLPPLIVLSAAMAAASRGTWRGSEEP